YEWDFGEPGSHDNVAFGKFASHSYLRQGLYVVRLNVTDDRDAVTTVVKTVFVGNRAPLPRASVDTPIQLPPARLTFNATGSSDPDGTIVKYRWDFKDGKPAVEGDVVHAQTVSHDFTTRGVFMVSLTAYDDDGGNATTTVQVTILNQRRDVQLKL